MLKSSRGVKLRSAVGFAMLVARLTSSMGVSSLWWLSRLDSEAIERVAKSWPPYPGPLLLCQPVPMKELSTIVADIHTSPIGRQALFIIMSSFLLMNTDSVTLSRTPPRSACRLCILTAASSRTPWPSTYPHSLVKFWQLVVILSS